MIGDIDARIPLGSGRLVGDPETGLPRSKAEARKWVRHHWADLIRQSDMGAVAELASDHINAVWGDECDRIYARLTA